jgi:hypothetical protein
MKCEECELLLAGVEPDGRADASVEDHLRGCAMCRALEEELMANSLALSSLRDDELPRVKTPELRRAVPRPAVPWIVAAAAAGLLMLIAHQASQRRPVVETPLRPQQVAALVTGPMRVTAKLPPAPAAKFPVRRKPKPAPRGAPLEQPLLVKMLTPDPDVVVYWLVD